MEREGRALGILIGSFIVFWLLTIAVFLAVISASQSLSSLLHGKSGFRSMTDHVPEQTRP